ncbi:MAG: sodium ABC transporter permease [Micrococcales bacterium]|nr:MAG: sodium ABC transporter permease [Micrococcales bacterium]PIE25843.1 MAG: sodium ABC transporter permease [Micrococcales bacterium]
MTTTGTDTRTGQPADDITAAAPNRPWAVVATRELLLKLTDKSFIIGTATTIAMFAAIFGANYFLANRSQHFDIAVTDARATAVVERTVPGETADGSGAQAAAEDERTTLTAVTVTDRAAGEEQVRAGEVDALLVRADAGWTLIGDTAVDPSMQDAVAERVRGAELGTVARESGRTLDELYRSLSVQTSVLSADRDTGLFDYVAGVVFAMLFYFANLLFGLGIAQSITQEKQSRIVEIIAAAIPLRDLLLGKVLAALGLAVIQLAVYAAAVLAGLRFSDYVDFLPRVAAASGWFAVYFVVGFIALSCLWAMVGAMASSVEDLQYTTQPLQIGLMGCFVGGMFITGSWLTAASYIPIVSAIAMPRRMLEESAQWWEVAVSLGLTALFAVLALRFGALVFRRTLLRTGGRITFREAVREAA